jgi:hypothetical protein
MRAITKDDVLAYASGLITDPSERREIEEARECDPIVRRWFALLTEDNPDEVPGVFRKQAEQLADRWMTEVRPAVPTDQPGRMTATKYGYRYVVQVEWGKAAARTGADAPPDWEPAGDSAEEIDLAARVVRFTYPAKEVPFGVARVSAEIDGERVGWTLAAFREWGAGDATLRQAEVRLTHLGIPLKSDSVPALYVQIAREENLSEFDVEEVRRLRDRCNGDRELRAAVELLLARLEREGAK